MHSETDWRTWIQTLLNITTTRSLCHKVPPGDPHRETRRVIKLCSQVSQATVILLLQLITALVCHCRGGVRLLLRLPGGGAAAPGSHQRASSPLRTHSETGSANNLRPWQSQSRSPGPGAGPPAAPSHHQEAQEAGEAQQELQGRSGGVWAV